MTCRCFGRQIGNSEKQTNFQNSGLWRAQVMTGPFYCKKSKTYEKTELAMCSVGKDGVAS